MLLWCSKYNIPGILYYIFFFTGLLPTPRKSKWNIATIIIFIIILMYVNVDNWIFIAMCKNEYNTAYIAYIIPYALTAWMWYVIYMKRKELSILLDMFQKCKCDEKLLNISAFLILCLPMINALIFTFQSNAFKSAYCPYGFSTNAPLVQFTIALTKLCIFSSVYPLYTDLVAFLYCTLCFRCSKFLNDIIQEIADCPSELLMPTKRLEIIKEKSRIDEITNAIEDVFSLPTFIIAVANQLTCFSFLSLYFTKRLTDYSALDIVVFVLKAANCFGCCVFVLWMASKVNLEDKRFKESFRTKLKHRMIAFKTREDLQLEKWLLEKPDIVFTGCDIFPYRRNSIFVVVGALLTYTVLITEK
ncbi:hypothetical protein HNY73_008894 [Argiope bruennichi]|uniref:Gustatory receptor n=1 Tax=Argiope bruennichi TaxID=94029 RepID=A0A8T0FCX2_ARGBR|nr:hypothetical protein HNY73_008894 [Argiope bruennichi]